jgi:hypothetical protein
LADLKISALPASTTPLAGTEVLPIVQSSTTKQVSIANLTAGRAISASTVTATTTMGVGAATPATTGAGITFPATQSSSSNANTLDDYEEGTVTDTGIALTFAVPGDLAVTYGARVVTYTKTGNIVQVQGRIFASAFTFTTSTGNLQLTGFLPFAPSSSSVVPVFSDGGTWLIAGVFCVGLAAASTTVNIYYQSTTNGVINGVEQVQAPSGSAKVLYFSFSYQTAT